MGFMIQIDSELHAALRQISLALETLETNEPGDDAYQWPGKFSKVCDD